MRSERGQATVEWIGIVLLVAVALAALGRFAPRVDGRNLGATLVHSVTCAVRDGCENGHPSQRAGTDPPQPTRRLSSTHMGFVVPPLVPRPGQGQRRPGLRVPDMRTLARWARRVGGRELAERLRRGAGLAWRRAWFGCLAYERARYAFLHPESRFPGHTIPPSELLRMANDCISPVDLVRDWPLLRGR